MQTIKKNKNVIYTILIEVIVVELNYYQFHRKP